MTTERQLEMQNRMKKEGKKWIARVVNVTTEASVETLFDSEKHTFENILHKIKLDLMTNLTHGIKTPICIQIREMNK